MLVLSWVWGQKLEKLSVIHQLLAILADGYSNDCLSSRIIKQNSNLGSCESDLEQAVSWAVYCGEGVRVLGRRCRLWPEFWFCTQAAPGLLVFQSL